jgi:monoamine oxidase
MTGVSRRAFVAQATLNAMGLLATPVAFAAPPRLEPGSGKGRQVVILGAGIAGLTAAYCLGKAGYQCRILEARARPGGRVWTIRGGDRLEETDSSQTAAWETHRDLYFNAGAARLSSHHHGILGYCRELGVPLELFINDNRSALVQLDSQFDGKPLPMRRVLADLRGGIAASAAKGVLPDDANLRALFRRYGDLRGDLLEYKGSWSAGFASEDDAPGGGNHAGVLQQPLPLGDIAAAAAASETVALALVFTESWHQSPSMLQPVGGMDAIPRAFARVLNAAIHYNTEVVRLERQGERARIVFHDRQADRRGAIEADLVICTIPLPVLKSIPADFSPAVRKAIEIGAGVYVPAVKVAFQTPSRWWETEQQLYGGISWTGRDITQIWYPSHGFNGGKGILVGAYIWDDGAAGRYAGMTPDQRRQAAIADGERLHPGYAKRVGAAMSISWSKVPYSLGGWADWLAFPGTRREAYPALLAGDGPFLFAGEHMSYINGWQEGAVQSAHYTVAEIARRVAVKRI